MISFKKIILILLIFVIIFPLPAFSSRKKVKDYKLTEEELAEVRAQAEAEIEARRQAAALEEQERLEAERLEAERLEAERLEAERLEAERLEKERLEQEQLAKEKEEAERLEAERLEAERLEAERLEKERLEAERLEAERLENERKLAEVAASRYKKEYLSDYIVPDVSVLFEEDEPEYRIGRLLSNSVFSVESQLAYV